MNVKVPGIHLFLVISVAAVTPTSDTILKVLRDMVVSESRELKTKLLLYCSVKVSCFLCAFVRFDTFGRDTAY